MSLIDTSFFVGDINIPNTDNDSVKEALNVHIRKYEVDYLISVLGVNLYKALITAAGTPPLADKWNKLLYGTDYQYNSEGVRWKGLINKNQNDILSLEDGELVVTPDDDQEDFEKSSPISLYVYYWFIRNNYTQTTGSGEVSSKNENSIISNPGLKLARAWNEMVDWTWDLYNFLSEYKTDYPEWDGSYNVYFKKFRKINTFNI